MGTLTRFNAESTLNDRRGKLLAKVGKTATVVNGQPNAVYNDALREGCLALGVAPAAWDVADGDLSPIADASVPQLLDVAELRLLKSVLGGLTSADQKVGLGEQKLGQFRKDVAGEVAMLQTQLREQYGYGVASVVAGRVDLGFAQTDPCASEPLWEGW